MKSAARPKSISRALLGSGMATKLILPPAQELADVPGPEAGDIRQVQGAAAETTGPHIRAGVEPVGDNDRPIQKNPHVGIGRNVACEVDGDAEGRIQVEVLPCR